MAAARSRDWILRQKGRRRPAHDGALTLYNSFTIKLAHSQSPCIHRTHQGTQKIRSTLHSNNPASYCFYFLFLLTFIAWISMMDKPGILIFREEEIISEAYQLIGSCMINWFHCKTIRLSNDHQQSMLKHVLPRA